MHPPDLYPPVLSTQAQDRLACVKMLLHMGADHTSQEIKSNKTVLHLAVQAANPTLVQLLLALPRGDLRAFVNMKVGAWAGMCRLGEVWQRWAAGCWGSCGCGCGGDDV